MNISKKRWFDIALVLVIGLLLFTPIVHYFKRNFLPNNEIIVDEKTPLNEESLSLQLKGYNTPDITLADTKGKVTFLHFWGTWCADCNLEMPSVEVFYQQHGKDINFVLVDMEKNDNYEKLTKYIEKYNYNAPMYEAISPISRQLQVTQWPTTFIIDKEGNIVSKHEGATEWTLPQVQKPILALM